jgi:hypothetical protein
MEYFSEEGNDGNGKCGKGNEGMGCKKMKRTQDTKKTQ